MLRKIIAVTFLTVFTTTTMADGDTTVTVATDNGTTVPATAAESTRIITVDGSPLISITIPSATIPATPTIVREQKTEDMETEKITKKPSPVTLGGRFAIAGFDHNPTALSSYGYGVSIGAAVSIPLAQSVALIPEINFAYRMPHLYRERQWEQSSSNKIELLYSKTAQIDEFAASAQTVFRGTLTPASKVYFEAGVRADFPFGVRYSERTEVGLNGDKTDLDYTSLRADADFGIVYGAGVRITDNIAAGVRNTTYLTSYEKAASVKFSQFDIGVEMMFNIGKRGQ